MEELHNSKSDSPPSHFILKIESFSSLLSCPIECYESCEFDAGDHKWKLALYPNGNKEKGGQNHISLYLVAVDKLDFGKEIQAAFSLFVYDHIRDKYTSLHQRSRFYSIKSESGFDKFLLLEVFKNSSNGYLIKDTCVFGAEVFPMSSTVKGQCLSMTGIKQSPFKYTWKVEKFSELEDEAYYSEPFKTAGHDWKISFYPKGHGCGKGTHISLYLQLADSAARLGVQVVVECRLRVVDQINKKHKESVFTKCTSSSAINWGFATFLALVDLNGSSGYLVNDTCILEAEVVVHGSADLLALFIDSNFVVESCV